MSAPGWTLFAGEDRGVHHGRVYYWVVDPEGKVVAGEPVAALSRVYEKLELGQPDSPASAEDLAWIAVALLSSNERLLDARRHHQLCARYDCDALDPPRLTRAGTASSLVFWVSEGHGLAMRRYELRVSPTYEVRVSVTAARPIEE